MASSAEVSELGVKAGEKLRENWSFPLGEEWLFLLSPLLRREMVKGIRTKGLVPHGQDKRGVGGEDGALAAERCTGHGGQGSLLAGLGMAPVEAGEGNRLVLGSSTLPALLPKGSPAVWLL